MTSVRRAVCLAVLVLSLGSVTSRAIEVQHQNGVDYVSGGVGDDERKALESMSGQFNLKLTFALANGHFLGGAKVRILDDKGGPILEANADGPLFYARLTPGGYMVQVDRNGKQVRRSVQIPAKGQQHMEFAWKNE